MGHNMKIGDRLVGDGQATFVIAELGINHNGDPDIARKMIAVAAEAGADAVKFQTYKTETMVAQGNPYYEIFRNAELSSIEDLAALQKYSGELGILFFSSAATESGFEVLEQLDPPLYKVSSANLTNIPLVRRVGAKGKPVIISSGAAELSEVSNAAETMKQFGAPEVAVLKCTSIYPCPPEYANLAGISTLRSAFDGPVGFSDHTIGSTAAIAAIALGASIIEKHFTLDKTMEGHDHHYSADPGELKAMIDGIRAVEMMLGSDRLQPVGEEVEFRAIGRRYVTAMTDIDEGQLIEPSMVYPKRPKDGAGVLPEHIEIVIGRAARRSIAEGSSIKWADI
jgi:N,N'-diacetyllegionaminate synthase